MIAMSCKHKAEVMRHNLATLNSAWWVGLMDGALRNSVTSVACTRKTVQIHTH